MTVNLEDRFMLNEKLNKKKIKKKIKVVMMALETSIQQRL